MSHRAFCRYGVIPFIALVVVRFALPGLLSTMLPVQSCRSSCPRDHLDTAMRPLSSRYPQCQLAKPGGAHRPDQRFVACDARGLEQIRLHELTRAQHCPGNARHLLSLVIRSAHRLTDSEQIPFAVTEPCRPFTDAASGGVVADNICDPIDGFETWQVDVFEHDTPMTQLRYHGI
jgi:hypothetical protein